MGNSTNCLCFRDYRTTDLIINRPIVPNINEIPFNEEKTKKIIAIQSNIRGFLERKYIKNKFSTENRIKNMEKMKNHAKNHIKTFHYKEEKSFNWEEIEKEEAEFLSNKDSKKREFNHLKFNLDSEYMGECIGKTRDGRGVQIWNNHSIYEGIWENNHLRKGRLIFSNGDSYCGYFINDKAHGKGKLVKKSGGFYDGDWFEEKKHGYGIEVNANGDHFEGTFNEGMKEGKGKFEWEDGSIYDGEFLQNMIHGYGSYLWLDGRKYVGNWKENLMHGKGTFSVPKCGTYDGDFVDDQRQGHGIYIWPDGKKYVGEWKDGFPHGNGYIEHKNFNIVEGEWAFGKKIR